MKIDFVYRFRAGRMFLNLIQKTSFFEKAADFMHSGASRIMIKPYIRRNDIDMTPFEGQKYRTFADFFARKRYSDDPDFEDNQLISPCDGLLSIYPIEDDMEIAMKGSRYILPDLIPDRKCADQFAGGLCMVIRLEASDYHHFCYFDDCEHEGSNFIAGVLHSVQPLASRKYPVYRLNRRWWTILDTKHFGRAAQIEVGAMLVGGVTHLNESGRFMKGAEMGNFELCGSTILILLGEETRKNLVLEEKMHPSWRGGEEVRIRMGESIGYANE